MRLGGRFCIHLVNCDSSKESLRHPTQCVGKCLSESGLSCISLKFHAEDAETEMMSDPDFVPLIHIPASLMDVSDSLKEVAQ